MRQLIPVCFLCTLSSVFGQIPDERLPVLLDSLLQTKAPAPGEPGFSVCIVRNGGIVYERQYGLADVERQRPITAATPFNIGSVSKQFTAAAVLLLEEEGKLRLSDPIHRYIPELPDFGREITIAHLIGHTSGLYSLPEVLALQSKSNNKRLTTEYLLQWLRRHPVLMFEPGSYFSYSNSGYMLLYLLIERVSGMSAGDYMKRTMFEPLGMHSARWAVREKEGIPEGHPSYIYLPEKKKFKKGPSYINVIGATGVHCTLRDLALWQLNFENNRLGRGGQAWVEKMTTPQYVHSGASTHYGAGLLPKTYQGIPTVEHSGGWNNFLVQCRRFPEQGISVLVASNNNKYSPFPIADAICDVLFDLRPVQIQQASQLASLPVPPAELEGTYLSFHNRIRYIRLSGDTLRIVPDESPQKSVTLLYLPDAGNDTLLVFQDLKNRCPVRFTLDHTGEIKGFYWEAGDYFVMDRFFEKLDTQAVVSEKWTGRYRSDVFTQNLAIRRKQGAGALQVKPVFFLGYPLERVTDSVYILREDDLVLRFTEDELVLGSIWIIGGRFKKRRVATLR